MNPQHAKELKRYIVSYIVFLSLPSLSALTNNINHEQSKFKLMRNRLNALNAASDAGQNTIWQFIIDTTVAKSLLCVWNVKSNAYSLCFY